MLSCLGCAAAEAGEVAPLKAPLKDGPKGPETPTFDSRALAAPIAIIFYVAVAVVKVLLTKVLLVEAKTPIALSVMSVFVTCCCLVPVFLVKPKLWGTPDLRKNGIGLAFCVLLLSLDMGFTNIAMSLLAVSIQQCILAVNPTFTVIIESFYWRRMNHPVIYLTVCVLCVGPVLTNLGGNMSKVNFGGMMSQLAGVLCSACKYVFLHSVMRECKKDLGSSFAFLFWLDLFSLAVLLPWALINGELALLFRVTHGSVQWMKVIGNSALGGLRFFSQLLVLRYSTATNLACANVGFQAILIYISLFIWPEDVHTDAWFFAGTALTITTSAVYAYWKTSGILTRIPQCIKLHDDFGQCITCGARAPLPVSK